MLHFISDYFYCEIDVKVYFRSLWGAVQWEVARFAETGVGGGNSYTITINLQVYINVIAYMLHFYGLGKF